MKPLIHDDPTGDDLRDEVQTALASLVDALAPFDYVVRQIAVKRLETELDLLFWSSTRRLDPEGYRSYVAGKEPQPPSEAHLASD